jgi:hypothetical protein
MIGRQQQADDGIDGKVHRPKVNAASVLYWQFSGARALDFLKFSLANNESEN